uniref:Peptidase S1 domain-containing protein n=1 Tax=Megaselia scalaris TaxID=36166 RepID=T1H1D0_MEGSC
FNSFKRPICLWNYENNIRGVINRKGVIAGWGSDENNLVSTEPKMLEVSIADPDWCLRSNDEIARHTTNRTFCAGDRNGKGPCHGDSGTGISIIENGRWTLRGLVSATLNKRKSDDCDFKEFTIYTDVAQFIPWILAS